MIPNHLVGKMSTNYYENGMNGLEIKGKKVSSSAHVIPTSAKQFITRPRQ